MSPDSKEMTLCPGSRSKYFLNVFSKSKMFSVPPSVDTTGIDGTCFWLKGISTKLIRLLTACLHETGVGGHLFPRAHPQFLVCFLLECFNKLSEDNPPPPQRCLSICHGFPGYLIKDGNFIAKLCEWQWRLQNEF